MSTQQSFFDDPQQTEFSRTYYPDLLVWCRRRFGADAAADVAQETMCHAFRVWDTLDRSGDLTRWLHTVAKNVAIGGYRKTRRLVCVDNLPDGLPRDADPDPAMSNAIAKERVRIVRAALRKLRRADRYLLYLLYYKGIPTDEIAEMLEVSPNTVRQRLFRARQQLLRELSPIFDNCIVFVTAVASPQGVLNAVRAAVNHAADQVTVLSGRTAARASRAIVAVAITTAPSGLIGDGPPGRLHVPRPRLPSVPVEEVVGGVGDDMKQLPAEPDDLAPAPPPPAPGRGYYRVPPPGGGVRPSRPDCDVAGTNYVPPDAACDLKADDVREPEIETTACYVEVPCGMKPDGPGPL